MWRIRIWLGASVERYGFARVVAWVLAVAVLATLLIAIALFATTLRSHGLLN